MHKKLMIQGTASGVGKSTITAAICRILFQDGHRVAPFKPQNMAASAHVLPNGQELGIGQALQARACCLEPTADMNPILLKPLGAYQMGLYIQGNFSAKISSEEFKARKIELRKYISDSYKIVANNVEYVVLEGAGSSAEINMQENDLSNMGTAELVDAPVLLVADIDRGGVFASIFGTIMLQSPENRARIKGIIINKFRGKKELLQSGIEQIYQLTGVPTFGVLPYQNLTFEEEDSLCEPRTDMGDSMRINDAEYQEQLEFDRLANVFRQHIDMDAIYNIFA